MRVHSSRPPQCSFSLSSWQKIAEPGLIDRILVTTKKSASINFGCGEVKSSSLEGRTYRNDIGNPHRRESVRSRPEVRVDPRRAKYSRLLRDKSTSWAETP